MSARDLFTSPFQEPLGLLLSALPTPESLGTARCRRFEFACRGDHVPGHLLLPGEGDGPFPLVLLQGDPGGGEEAPDLGALKGWLDEGAAVASIDLPLHGERASAKLSQRLAHSLDRGLDGGRLDSVSTALWVEFVRQAVLDLRRALDSLASLPEIDESRAVFAGFRLGGAVGAILCAIDSRPKAAALALTGGGFGPSQVDPCTHIAGFAPRPLLLVSAKRDEGTPRKTVEALFAAARVPKRIEWLDADQSDLGGAALSSVWRFLRSHLAIGS